MKIIIKIIVLFLFFTVNVTAQNSAFFKDEIKPKLHRSLKKPKVIFWSDKKTYKIGEKINIIVEWNKGNLKNPDRFENITNLPSSLTRMSFGTFIFSIFESIFNKHKAKLFLLYPIIWLHGLKEYLKECLI